MRYVRTFFALWLLALAPLSATPTSVFWTNCTTATQPYTTFNAALYNFFTVVNHNEPSSFPPDLGLTYGLFDWNGISSEVGVDFLGGYRFPWLFNGKIALKEGLLFDGSPSASVGMYSIGVRSHTNNPNVLLYVLGKTLPDFIGGTFYVGGYHGSKAIGHVQDGVMIAYERCLCMAKDEKGRAYKKCGLAADYAFGKNSQGGGGVGISYYLTPDAYILTGPVFFNDKHLNGRWKWSVQVNVSF